MNDRDDELDGLRIRQFATLRRAIYRSRSHAIIAAGVCTVAGIQLGVMIVREIISGPSILTIAGYLAGIAISCWGITYFMKRAIQFHREAQRTTLPPPPAPPDFTQLGDGSDVVDRLNRIE